MSATFGIESPEGAAYVTIGRSPIYLIGLRPIVTYAVPLGLQPPSKQSAVVR